MNASRSEPTGAGHEERIRVLIVDDAPIWRESLRRDLEREPDMAVAGEAEDGERAVQLARDLVPDVVLMDLSMPGMGGTEATRLIDEELPGIRVLVLTQLEEDEDVLGAIRAGAVGYLLKDINAQDLMRDVRRVFEGEVVFTPRLAGLVLEEIRHPTRERPAPPLSEREGQILRLLAQGKPEGEIAERFALTPSGLRNEVRSIVFKLRILIRPVRPEPRPGPVFDERERRPSPDRWRHPLRLGARSKLALWVLVTVVALIFLGAATRQLPAINRSVFRSVTSPRSHVLTQAVRIVGYLGSPWTLGVLRIGIIVVLLLYRRWQHLLAFMGSFLLIEWLVSVTPPGGGAVLNAGGLAPSAPVAGFIISILGVAYGLATPGRRRRVAFAATSAIVAALGFAEVYLGVAPFTSALMGAVVGSAVSILAFALIAPEAIFPVTYKTHDKSRVPVDEQAIREAMHLQLGMTVLDVRPLAAESAGGSTPLVIRVRGSPADIQLFGKLYAVSHMRSDRLYKLARMALYGALEDEKPFNSVRRLAEYEDYILRYMEDSGIRTADPYGVVELDPELQYLLVTEFLDGSEPLLRPRETIGRETVRDALSLIRGLWRAGLAHRDIKPSNLLLREGKVYVIDAAFCQVRPSPWRQAVDLANMMLVLALRVDPKSVYEEALGLFTEDEIAEAFAATHSVTMPAQVRQEIKKDGRDLVAIFRALALPRKPIGIQRWSARRIAVTVGGLAALVTSLVVTYVNLHRLVLR